ncbi:MAG TPA: RluA family pseudouridine synthase, partial [bacterium]|nr:RluA family pseudouridine synthase [bacterium]
PYRDGWSLREFLSHRFRYHPPAIWDERIEAGAVRVNGTRAGGERLLAVGDRISYSLVHAEPEVDFRFTILHEDDDCLAVAKSGNLPVHAGGRYIKNTLIAHLREIHGSELRLAHRLDRETSGIVLLAKTRAAAVHFEREFHSGRVVKKYHAVLRGHLPLEAAVDAPIGRAPLEDPDPPRWRVIDPPAGKPSRTLFRRLATAQTPQGPCTLALAIPESGRTNQIRIHAAHMGHPILGDKVYAVPLDLVRAYFRDGESPDLLAAAGAHRHLLHAAELSIAHPRDGRLLELRAPLPADFELSWTALNAPSLEKDVP